MKDIYTTQKGREVRRYLGEFVKCPLKCIVMKLFNPYSLPRSVIDESIFKQCTKHKKHAGPRPDVNSLKINKILVKYE